jgi:hypothetical protein
MSPPSLCQALLLPDEPSLLHWRRLSLIRNEQMRLAAAGCQGPGSPPAGIGPFGVTELNTSTLLRVLALLPGLLVL